MARTHHHLSQGKPFTVATRSSAREDRRPWRSAWSPYLGCPEGKGCTVCGKLARRATFKRKSRMAVTLAIRESAQLEERSGNPSGTYLAWNNDNKLCRVGMR